MSAGTNPSSPRSERRTLFSGAVLSGIAHTMRMGSALVTVPLAIGYLGSEAYGLWMVTLSALSIVTFFDAGIMPAAKNKMTEAFANGDRVAFSTYASAMLLTGFAVIGASAPLIPLLYLPEWSRILDLHDPLAIQAAPHLIASAAVVSVLSVGLAGIDAVYAARLRPDVTARVNVMTALLGVGFLVACVRYRAPVALFPIATVGPLVVARATLLAAVLLREGDLLSVRWANVRRALRTLLPTSAGFLVVQLTNVSISAAPNLLLVASAGVTSVAAFSVSQRLASVPLSVLAAVLPVFWPAFTVQWARGQAEHLRRNVKLCITTTVACLAPFAAAMIAWGPNFIEIWTRHQVTGDRTVLAALAVWVILQGVASWLSTVLHSITDVRIQVLTNVAQAALLLIVGGISARAMGPQGVGMSMCAALLVATIVPLGWRVNARLRANRRASPGRHESTARPMAGPG